MTDALEVDVTALHSAARSIEASGERLGAEVQRLQGTVTGSASPWGGDEAGTVFGAAYTEVLQHALDVYASMADQLLSVADRLGAAADAHERSDLDNAALFTRLGLPAGPTAAS
ncbi:WXG100 family type VII secretion target [Micromonospora ureilytica]|uniref:WXG100 family type VII secretion target n=1 Tax=Micromonospora ureilytica TaxID=709868 RepID=UPI002E0EB3FC|nr:WXG100 family type VII secretion target [Micromonospora ureilytica]